MTAGIVVAIVISGFFTGALARFAVPGPDPMPAWLTLSIGLTGSIIGALVARAFHGAEYVVSVVSLSVAIALVLAYRRFVQHRALWGPEAMRFPKRGLGVEGYRERLTRMGLDPDAVGRVPDPKQVDRARLQAMLDELHRAGVLDDEELAEKRRALADRG